MNNSKFYWHFSGILLACLDVFIVLIPIAVWAIIIGSTSGSSVDIFTLPEWQFACLSLFAGALQEGVRTWDKHTDEDERERDTVISASVAGIVVSTVLLTLASLQSRGIVKSLPSFFYDFTWPLLAIGFALLFTTKAVAHHRRITGSTGSAA